MLGKHKWGLNDPSELNSSQEARLALLAEQRRLTPQMTPEMGLVALEKLGPAADKRLGTPGEQFLTSRDENLGLGSPDAALISSTLQERAIKRGAAGADAAARAKFETEPLISWLPQGKVLVNPETGRSALQDGMMYKSAAEAERRGYSLQMNEKAWEGVQDVKEVRAILDVFETESENLKKFPGNISAGSRAKLAMFFGKDDPLLSLDILGSTILRVAKTLQGSANQLSNLDVDAVREFLPNKWDEKGLAERRIRLLNSLLQSMEDAALGREGARYRAHSIISRIEREVQSGKPAGSAGPRSKKKLDLGDFTLEAPTTR